jgi:hypothetical protein
VPLDDHGWTRVSVIAAIAWMAIALRAAGQTDSPGLPPCSPMETEPAPGRSAPAFALSGSSPKIIEQRLNLAVPGCYIDVTVEADEAILPSTTARYGFRVLIQAAEADRLLRVDLVSSRSPNEASQMLPVRDLSEEETRQQSITLTRVASWFESSDGARPEQQLSVPRGFRGTLRILRLDLNQESTTVTVQVIREDLVGLREGTGDRRGNQSLVFQESLALTGTAVKANLSAADYQALISLAAGYREREETATDTKHRVYTMVSELLGRRIEPKVNKFATRTEPIVVFLGLSGLNRIALLDCLAWPMPAVRENPKGRSDCERLAEPWQTTFEGTHNFWAAYIEDDLTTFDTSIDLQFGDDRRTPDYDEFDALSTLRLSTSAAGGSGQSDKPRRVRIGFRRFRIPHAQRITRVTFSRQGSAYGLRSWSRDYVRYGSRWPRLAVGAAVGVPIVTRRSIVLNNVYDGAALSPSAFTVSEDRTRQPIMATGFVRFPEVRAAAEQARIGWRFYVPSVAFGVGFPVVDGGLRDQTFGIGGGWQLTDNALFHFVLMAITRRDATTSVAFGQRVPLSTTIDAVSTPMRTWGVWLGLSVDLTKTP